MGDLPKEHELIASRTPGMEHKRHQYLNKVAANKGSEGPTGQKQPSKWAKVTDNDRPAPTPVNWGTIEKVPPPKTATNVRSIFESGNIPDLHGVEKTQVELKKEEGSGEFENQPDFREGVVRESDVMPDGKAGEGHTSQLLDHWVSMKDEFTIDRVINIKEDDGATLENQPTVREGVYRETDPDETPKPEEGTHKNLQNTWLNVRERSVERKPIKLVENENEGPGIYENEPAPALEDVTRETDYNEELQPIIPDRHSRQMRELWYELGREHEKEPKREMVSFTPPRELSPGM